MLFKALRISGFPEYVRFAFFGRGIEGEQEKEGTKN